MTRFEKLEVKTVRGEDASTVADKQPILTPTAAGKLVLVLFALVIAVATIIIGVRLYQMNDPYMRDVFALTGHADRGEAIFQINCAGCHGVSADGNVGPSLREVSRRRSKLSIVHQVTDGRTPPMPKFQPAPQDMADLLEYLQSV